MIGLIVVILSGVIASLLPASVLPEIARMPFEQGGWGMRLILFALLVSLWLTIDRAVVLVKASFDARGFVDQIRSLMATGDVASAKQLCDQTDRPLGRIVGAGLARAAEGEDKVLKAMDERAYGEVPVLEKRTGYLALMGNVATLMGLFGTIIGLIHSFGAVGAAKDVGDKATQLAAGISEAMNCTAFGLLTGIFALVAFSVLNGKTQALLDEINHLSLRAFRAWKTHAKTAQALLRPIDAPHPHLMSHAGLNKAGSQGRPKRSTFASLQLTPLIDMFIVMVIFLLMSFSASGEIGAASKDIKLPFAEKVDELKRALMIAITHPEGAAGTGVITLEGREVATAQELLDDDGPDWKIAKLVERLEVHKTNWKVTHPSEDFPGEVILQVDQSVDFKIIKKVMYSAGVAGYTNLLFAVTRKSEDDDGGGGH